MSRTLGDARAWAALGNEVFAKAVQDLTDEDLRQPSTLPDWSVGNLVAHVAANGDALLNLVRWAKTGIETPMYAGPEDRTAASHVGTASPPATPGPGWPPRRQRSTTASTASRIPSGPIMS